MKRLMLASKIIIIFAMLTIPAILVAGFWYKSNNWSSHENSPLTAAKRDGINYIDVKVNPVLFYPAIKQYPAGKGKGQAKVLIAPHHDLASRLVAGIFSNLAGDRIKTIYIIGPNHKNSGAGRIITAPVIWKTDLGQVSADFDAVNLLKRERLAVFDAKRLESEHSINTLLPFIKNYFPRAKVVPLILFHDAEPEAAARLADFIYGRAGEDDLVIGSLDFSHYLSNLEAEKNDKITEQAIKNFAYKKILSFNDDFVDSPITLAVIMKAASGLGAVRPEFFGHGNSAGLANTASALSSTSYFTILFNQK